MSERMLTVSDINVYYGAIHAIKNVSFEVNEGEVVALIGANGAGKSTRSRPCRAFCVLRLARSSSSAKTSCICRPISWLPPAWRTCPRAAEYLRR